MLAQNTIKKDICLFQEDIDPSGNDVFSDDPPFQMGFFPSLLINDSPCYFDDLGLLFISTDESCCDTTFVIEYIYPQEGPPQDKYVLSLTVKCDKPIPKPNCTSVYLSPPDSTRNGDPVPSEKITYYACDSTPVNYFVDEALGQSILWSTSPSAQIIPTVNNYEVQILWPGPGSYTLTVDVGGDATDYCIEVLESPMADFSIAGGCGCLNTPVAFQSTGLGGDHFFWDFGDGVLGSGPIVSHEYTSSGLYNVTLIVVQDNIDDEMNPLCCCADTIVRPIEILNLEGPEILWISTLCEGDTTKYWTEDIGPGCMFSWSAMDADGNNVLPQGTITNSDTLCVPWGDGPYGEVSLLVTGCTNANYCSKPTTAIIPIIETLTTISGKDTVCYPSGEFYSVPKWPTVEYEWDIIPPTAGTFTSDGNSIFVNWNGSATSATIVVNYQSDFLGGIVGHDPADCAGYAELDVSILPRFQLDDPNENRFCLNEPITFNAGPAMPSTVFPLQFIWEIAPPIGPTTITTLPGMMSLTTSFSISGYYDIKVYPSSPNPYCNDTIYKTIEIVEVPSMDAIEGPKDVCEGDTVTYFGLTSIPATEFNWVVTGGTFLNGINTGNPVTIIWNSPGPYIVGAYQSQLNDPECSSDTIYCPVSRRSIGNGYSINGPGACVNEIMSYNLSPLPVDPDVNFSWEIKDNLSGSIVSGDTGPVVDIQWNDMVGVDTICCTLTLCNDTLVISRIISLSEAALATITQNMPYCTGAVGVTLTASTSGASYDWTTPAPSPSNTTSQTVNVSAPGNYVVEITEPNGCIAIANYEVFENGIPNVNLTSPDLLSLCTQDAGNTVELQALVGSYSYDWFKSTNGSTFSPDPETSPILTHTNNGVIGNCQYYYIATDLVSGCMAQSNTLLVSQDSCIISPPGCTLPLSTAASVSSSPAKPECNKINFTTNNSPDVTITNWNFNDPSLSNAYTGPITAPTFTYTEAGYYIAYMYGTALSADSSMTCTVSDTTAVCIPLAADFDFIYDCGEFTFTSISSWITGAAPNSYVWDFGDGNTGTGTPITHTYSNVNTTTPYTVTLTISNPDTCIAIKFKVINVNPPPIADIIVMPPDTCINKPFMFSNSNNTGIVGWNWEFGDMSSNGGENPKHSYTSAGTYMVTLTVTDENGCTNSDIESVVVHPAPNPGPITYANDLFLCPGESIQLNAPSGGQFSWTTGAITSSIIVNTAGIHGVTVTDLNGCTFIPDSVEVVVYPPVDATITGNPIICDEGCTTLFAPNVAGYNYTWTTNLGPTGNTNNSITICYDALNLITDVNLDIVDGNNCPGSNMVLIDYFISPDVQITPSNPILCEGTVTTLTASTTFPGPVDFNWSTTENGPVIDVILEGTYYVTVTDLISGCSRDTFINVNPLPDLCIIPYGCYTACDPDTICAPSGLDSYEWYYQGILQPMYTGMECIIVSQSGAYNFAGTNEFDCEAFSDTLYLEMIPCCRPGDTDISTFLPAGLEGCCYAFSYSVNQDIFYVLDLSSNDADLDLDPGSVNTLLSVASSVPSLNSFENGTSGNPLPQGPLLGFATICLENATNNPVEVIADWKGEDGAILCSDTLALDCLVEPDCIYVQSDSIYCDSDGNLIYDVTLCNPMDAAYSISYIDFLELTPQGIMLNPSEIDLSGNPLLPGDCIDLSLSILGSNPANQTFCYNLVGHQFDPNENPGALCCSVDTTYCVFLPGCTPCDMVYVLGIDSAALDECCYEVTVNNYFDDMIFTGIDLCVLSPSATFDIFNPTSSVWDVSSLSSTTASLDYNSGPNTTIALGDTPLPTICIGDNATPYVDVEIKWMIEEDVFCRDTISLLCPGDCGYLTENTSLLCGPNGTWVFTGYISNTSMDTMNTAFIDFGLDILNPFDTYINLNGLPPMQTFGPFTIVLNVTADIGPDLCIITTLHANDQFDNHEDCCQFKTVLEVPECETQVDCMCGPAFEEAVAQGINCDPSGVPFEYIFSPVGNLGACDQIVWDFKEQQVSYLTSGNQSITHTFPGPGEYSVCISVVRTQPDGKQCKELFCKDVVVSQEGFVAAFPNPVVNQVHLVPEHTTFLGMAKVELLDASNRKHMSLDVKMSDQIMSTIDVSGIKAGVYMLRINMDGEMYTKRILIVR